MVKKLWNFIWLRSEMRFLGRVAIITGGTAGIGFAIAQKLAKEGAHVVITSRKRHNVEEAVKKLQCEGIEVDGLVSHVANANDRRYLFEMVEKKWGRLDILVLNAGINPLIVPILDTPENVFDKIMDVNLKASFMASKEALPLLRRSKAGRIIYNSTIGGFQHVVQFGAYTVSKIGLFGLTKMAALQLAKENITVNCISPGLITTRFSEAAVEVGGGEDRVLPYIPLHRAGTPEEVANLVAFLVSDDACYITGENICVAGGLRSRL